MIIFDFFLYINIIYYILIKINITCKAVFTYSNFAAKSQQLCSKNHDEQNRQV